jgi:hypothetical protein
VKDAKKVSPKQLFGSINAEAQYKSLVKIVETNRRETVG